MKWDPSSSGAASLVYSTFLGGSGFDLGHGIAVDANGIVYVTGETGSNNFPLVNPIQATCGGGCPNPVPDVFISKLDVTKSGSAALLFSTYLGGSGTDTGESIAIDPQGNAYVTGQTYSSNFPAMMPFQPLCKNCSSSSDDGYLATVCITACPSSTVSTPSLAFGSQTLSSSSSSQPVILSNSGMGALTIISITASSGFLQTNSCGVVLSAGSNCTINVTFSPQSAGPASGSLTIASNASATATGVSLSGTGVVVTLAASPGGLTYAAQQVGTTSSSQPVTLSNPGGTSISVTGIQASGDFAQTNNCGASVAANSSCTVNVTFTPTAGGSRTGTLTITDNASGSPQTVSLSGTGANAVLNATPAALSFAAQALGSTSASQPVILSNPGPMATSISGIQASGDFAQTNTCGASVAASSSCTVNVTFTPSAAGTRTGTLTITDAASNSPQLVSLTGSGVTPTLSISTTSLYFGTKVVGTSSPAGMVTLSNSGSVAVTISSIQTTASDYLQTNNCGTSLNAGSNCVVNVVFQPTASGSRPGSLVITDNAAGGPQNVSFTGTGTIAQTSVGWSVALGSTAVGTSVSQSFTITDVGTVPLTIGSLSITGTNAADFSQTNNCSASIKPSGFCTVTVTFTPSATGSRFAALIIPEDGGGVALGLRLTGTGD